MPDKPTTADGYRGEHLGLVRAMCLYVATKLGDLMDDLVVVGGLVPSLLVDPAALSEGTAAHVGTMDLDVGLTIALLDEGRYRELTDRLRRAGFNPDVNDQGNPTRPPAKRSMSCAGTSSNTRPSARDASPCS